MPSAGSGPCSAGGNDLAEALPERLPNPGSVADVRRMGLQGGSGGLLCLQTSWSVPPPFSSPLLHFFKHKPSYGEVH